MQRPGFVEKLDRIQPYLLGAAALLLALCILFAGGEIGLSDNGDFSRVMRASSIARTVDDSRFVYISEYRIVLQDRSAAENVFGILFGSEGVNVYPSIQLLFTRVSVVLNLIVNKLSGAPMTTYRLGVPGVLYAVCYAAALALLFRQIHLRRRWMDWGAKLLLLLVLCDGDYLVYFNSFYGEALQIIAFVLVAAAAVRILSRRDCSVWDAVWAALACILYGWSKFANIPPAILLCLALEAILWRRSRSRIPVCAMAGAFVLLCAIYLAVPSWMAYETNYNSVFYGILKQADADEAERYLSELGLDPSLADLRGTNAYATGISQTVEERGCRDQIASLSRVRLLIFYARHPAMLCASIDASLRSCGSIRPYYLSNYDSSHPRFTLSSRFTAWSSLRARLGFDTPAGNIAVLIAFLAMMILLLWRRSRFDCVLSVIAVAGCCLYCMIVPYISNGAGDLAKHMFAYIQFMDAAVLVLFVGAAAGCAALGLRRWIPAGVAFAALLVLVVPPASAAYTAHAVRQQTHTAVESGAYVQFGAQDGQPLQWLVLSVEGNRAMLLCQTQVAVRSFSADNSNLWSESDLRTWLNSDFTAAFSATERTCMLSFSHPQLLSDANLESATAGDRDLYCDHLPRTCAANADEAYQNAVTDLVTLPDLTQIETLYASGCGTARGGLWWTASPYFSNENMVRCVFPDGTVRFRDAKDTAGLYPVICVCTDVLTEGDGSLANSFRLAAS